MFTESKRKKIVHLSENIYILLRDLISVVF